MRVALVEPRITTNARTVFAANNALEPLGLEYLGGVASELGCEVKIFVESILGGDLVQIVTKYKPDLVAFTSVTCNSRHTIELATTMKREFECVTVVGGYHASAIPEDFATQKCFDWVVVGEGEHAFASIVSGRAKKEDSVCGRILHSEREMCLGRLPRPFRDPSILDHCRLMGLMVPAPSTQRRVAVASTSRGCPNACSFCASASVWGQGRIARMEPADVVAEVQDLVSAHQVDAILFSDLAFNADVRSLVNMCEALITARLKTPWYCMCGMESMSDDVLALMAEAGCRKIGIGIERPMFDLRRAVKQCRIGTDDEMQRTIEQAHRRGILVKGYFMVGFPWETPATLQDFEGALARFSFDEMKISFVTPFPGTSLYEEHHESLLTRNWEDFDTVSVPVMRMEGLGADELLKWRQEAFQSFYTSTSYLDRMQARCAMDSVFKQAYADLFDQLRHDVELPGNLALDAQRTVTEC